MSIISGLVRGWRPAPAWGSWENHFSGGISRVGGATSAGEYITPDVALNCQDVMACMRVLSETVGMVPAHVYRRAVDGNGADRAYEHELYNIFHNSPNPETTKFTWLEMMIVDLVGWGHSINQVVYTQAGRVHAIWRLDPSRIKIDRKETGELIYILHRSGKEDRTFSRGEIFHVIGPFGGKSLITLARESIGGSIAATQYGGRFFSNDATPNLIMECPLELDDDSYKRMERSWNLNHQGVHRSHRMAILEQGTTVKPIGFSPEDAQFLATRRFAKEEIAGWFRLPPRLIGANEVSGIADREQSAIDAVLNGYMPWFVRIEQAAKLKFFATQRYYVEFDIKGLMRGDMKARAEWYAKMQQHGDMSINEVRRAENMNPIPGEAGDLRVVQGAMVDVNRVASGEWPKAATDPQKIEPKPTEQLPDPGESNAAEEMEKRSVEMERRAIDERFALRDKWRPKLLALSERVVSSEVDAIRSGMEKFRSRGAVEAAALKGGKQLAIRRAQVMTRSLEEFKDWLVTFYAQHRKLVDIQVKAVLRAYALEAGEAAAAQIEEGVPDLDEFITNFTEVAVGRHVGLSLGQLVTKADGKSLESFDEIDERLTEWGESRPDKIADSWKVRVAEAAAVAVFLFFGKALIWRTQSSACSNCKTLDGATVGREGYFASVGDVIDSGDGKTEPIHVKVNFKNPPLHKSCQCFIMPG